MEEKYKMKNSEREFTDREYLVLSGKLPGHQRRRKNENDKQLMEILRREQEECEM